MKNHIKVMRQRAGISQERLAELIGSGRSQIVKLERGERRLSTEWMDRIAKALHCDPRDLIAAPGQSDQPQASLPMRPIDTPSVMGSRDLPVHGTSASDTEGAISVDMDEPIDFVRRPPGLVGTMIGVSVAMVGVVFAAVAFFK